MDNNVRALLTCWAMTTGEIGMIGQAEGRGHPGDAAANNRDIHERTIRRSRAR